MIKTLLAVLLALFAAVAFAAVDANKATQAELETIKGIGPAISGKILDERKKSAFKDWQDMIDRVKGVGEGNAAKFSAEGLTVNGAAFGGAPAKAAAPSTKKEDKPAAMAATAKVAAPPATPAPAAKAEVKPAATAADEKKAAAKKDGEENKAATKKDADGKKADKAASAADGKKPKADKASASTAATESKSAGAAPAPASAAAKK